MSLTKKWIVCAASMALLLGAGCNKKEEVKAQEEVAEVTAEVQEVDLSQLDRNAFNRAAMRLNLPIFWLYEETASKTVRPEVLSTLNFYPTTETFVWKDADGKFTKAFYDAYALMVEVMKDPTMGAQIDDGEKARRLKVVDELDQAAVTVVASDFSGSDAAEKAFVASMLKVGKSIDALYAKQTGLDKVMEKIPADDVLSQSMARRNWGIMPESPKMKPDAGCRALAGDAKIAVGVYPESIQQEADFCTKLSQRADAEKLLTPFTVVVADEKGELRAEPYSTYFKAEMEQISADLRAAGKALAGNEKEVALQKYLFAAADAFETNNWDPADEAWASMNSTNSSWYVRVAPDEVYWEPCSRKAGFHMTFARINPEALAWQEKLTPIQQDMEDRLAKVAGKPYKARKVSFHLPDFIDIVTNSGDDRDAFGATIGQSLPNWGPVANEGRGRTVAMSNLYTDPDSLRDRKTLAQSMFTAQDTALLEDATGPGLLSTIIHEAAHNLGPAHEYKVKGKVDDELFGGGLASMAEELKAQTAAIWYLPYLVEIGVISQELATKSYADSIYWAFGHISRGMTNAEGRIQPYSQLAAIQIGMMLEAGALTFEADTMAANGTDKGAFVIHMDKMVACVDNMMKEIATIKAKGDKDALEKLRVKHVEGKEIPFKLIEERMLRLPKTSFVYSVKL